MAHRIEISKTPLGPTKLRDLALLRRTFEKLQASNVEIVKEPPERPYGVRDCAVRDPAGTMIRIQELR
jgi:catechol 2,3-dioxygenase-like lactoylglutathione lyase family enzyme